MRMFSRSLIVALAGVATPWAMAEGAACESCPGAPIKSGSGTIILSGPGSHAGTITLNSGTLALVDATFLGLITEPISLERAGDLNLPAGTGLSVVQVAPDSPAAKAGFQPSDVLAKLDDQILVNPAQLRVLVRSHAAADTLAFQIIRKGKTQTLKTSLGTQKMPELSPGGEEPRMFLPQGRMGDMRAIPFSHGELPPEILKQLPKELRDRAHRAPAVDGKAKAQVDDKNDDREQSSSAIILDGSGSPGAMTLNFSSRAVSNDGTHTIEIEHGKREHLRITGKDGKELYDGALPKTDKEWDKVPTEVRTKARAMAAAQNIRSDDAAAEPETRKEDGGKPGQSF